MKLTVLNARIPVGLKKAMSRYCEEKGLKVQAFIENLIQERLEDELDNSDEFGSRWFVYYLMDELIALANECGFEVLEKERLPHNLEYLKTVFWLSLLLKKL